MKNKRIKRILILQDIFAILFGLELIIMIIISSLFNLKSLVIMFLPIGISSLVWNKSLYHGLMYNKDALYAKSKMSYEVFIYIGLFLAILAAVSFGIAGLKWFYLDVG